MLNLNVALQFLTIYATFDSRANGRAIMAAKHLVLSALLSVDRVMADQRVGERNVVHLSACIEYSIAGKPRRFKAIAQAATQKTQAVCEIRKVINDLFLFL